MTSKMNYRPPLVANYASLVTPPPFSCSLHPVPTFAVGRYNEDATELTETLTKIGRNIKHMVRHPIDSPDFRKHGDAIWRSIVTTIICDVSRMERKEWREKEWKKNVERTNSTIHVLCD
jgi:hypothetical protein